MLRDATVYLPPKYNLNGNRQLWFIETGDESVDNLENGVVHGALSAVALGVLLTAGGFL
jgi:hypothetical protein